MWEQVKLGIVVSPNTFIRYAELQAMQHLS